MQQSETIVRPPSFNTITDLHERVDAMCFYAREHCNVSPGLCLEVAEKAYDLALELDYGPGQSFALDFVAYQHWHNGEVTRALEELEQSSQLQEEHGFYENVGWHHMTWAMILWGEGKYDQAFSKVYDALQITREYNNEEGQGMCYWALGVFYYDLKDYDKSLANYSKTLDIINRDLIRFDINATCYTLIGLGCCYKGKGENEKALEYFLQAQEKSKVHNQWMQEARTHYEIGLMQFDQNKLAEAEEALMKSYDMRKEHNTKPGMVSSLIALADLEVARNKMPKAMEHMEQALQLAIETNTKVKVYQCQQKLYELYKMQGNFEKALEYLEGFHQLRTEVVGEEASNKLKDLETKYATEKSEREAEIERLRNVELKKAHDTIAEKNQEITDSIKYAKRIQLAILPPAGMVNKYLEDSFILFKPKDIVAGDFYWMEVQDDKLFFTAADCTGHGVPGAMVSVLCSGALSKVVKELTIEEPAKILDRTVDILEERFSKSDQEVKDGMDLALCSLDLNTGQLAYAGANNPLYHIKDGELIEIKPDKQPVGKHDNRQPFTNHLVDTRPGDCIYIFTDGFADQFGGPKGKKFKYKPFKDLLLTHHKKPMEEQKHLLDEAIENWRGELEQVDDICIIGLRI